MTSSTISFILANPSLESMSRSQAPPRKSWGRVWPRFGRVAKAGSTSPVATSQTYTRSEVPRKLHPYTRGRRQSGSTALNHRRIWSSARARRSALLAQTSSLTSATSTGWRWKSVTTKQTSGKSMSGRERNESGRLLGATTKSGRVLLQKHHKNKLLYGP